MTPEEQKFVEEARQFLDNPSFLIRAAAAAGKPLDHALKLVPAAARERVQKSVQAALERGLDVITKTIPKRTNRFELAAKTAKTQGLLHSAATFGTGAFAGFFGAATLPVELPLTTAIMLRSIAQTAAEFGHDIRSRETQLECLYVLSLGAKGPGESAYWSSRLAFTDLIRQAILRESFVGRFLAQVATRFEIVVAEKAAAELVPIVGAIGGGAINAAFTEHFNTAARYHFGLRALEKKYGEDVVRWT